MHRRITKSCVFLAVALIGSAGNARAIECQSEKGTGYPWSWRQIDGKQCWYKGLPGMDKKQLHWAEATSALSAAKRPPSATNDGDDDDERLLHSYWPPLPQEGRRPGGK